MPEEEVKKSKFNAGVAQAERIHFLQSTLNNAKFNLSALNVDSMSYNYEVVQTCLDNLRMEAWGKATKTERTELDRLTKLLDKAAAIDSPIKIQTINGEQKQKFILANFNKFRDILRIYEKAIRQVLEEHNLNAPNKDWDDEDEF